MARQGKGMLATEVAEPLTEEAVAASHSAEMTQQKTKEDVQRARNGRYDLQPTLVRFEDFDSWSEKVKKKLVTGD